MGKYDLNQGNIITPVQSTFVDPGVETFKQAALLYRQQYDKNKDAYNLTKRAMAQMELMPGDESSGLRDQFVGNIDKNFEGVLETGAFEDATSAVQQNIDYVMTDKTILQAQRNALEFKKEEALIDQFGPSGILDFNKGARENFTTVTTDEEGNEVVNSYKEKMEQKEDYNAYMKNLIGTVKDEGWGGAKGIDINGDDVMDYLQTGNTKGVSQAKMDRVVNGLMGSYLDSKAGDQDMRRLTQIQGMSEQEAKADILNRMKGIGQPQVGMTPTVSHQQYKLGTGTSGSGNFKSESTDNWAVNNLLDGKTNLGFDVLQKMTGGTEATNVEGGLLVSGQNEIIVDYTRFLGGEKYEAFNKNLIANNIASNQEEATEVSKKLINYLAAERSGNKADQKRIAAELGYSHENKESLKKLQTLAKGAQQSIDKEQLQAMGTVMNLPVSGVFRPNQGATENASWINGNAVIDGEYWFTEGEIEDMADHMGLGYPSVDWKWGRDDIDNVEDAQGNKLFTKRKGKDGETDYWVIRGKSQPIKGEKIPQDALYFAAGHTNAQYERNESTLTAQREASLLIANSADHKFIETINKIPNAGPKVSGVIKNALDGIKRDRTLLNLPDPVGVYEFHAKAISKMAVNLYQQGKNATQIEDALALYVYNIGQKQQ